MAQPIDDRVFDEQTAIDNLRAKLRTEQLYPGQVELAAFLGHKPAVALTGKQPLENQRPEWVVFDMCDWGTEVQLELVTRLAQQTALEIDHCVELLHEVSHDVSHETAQHLLSLKEIATKIQSGEVLTNTYTWSFLSTFSFASRQTIPGLESLQQNGFTTNQLLKFDTIPHIVEQLIEAELCNTKYSPTNKHYHIGYESTYLCNYITTAAKHLCELSATPSDNFVWDLVGDWLFAEPRPQLVYQNLQRARRLNLLHQRKSNETLSTPFENQPDWQFYRTFVVDDIDGLNPEYFAYSNWIWNNEVIALDLYCNLDRTEADRALRIQFTHSLTTSYRIILNIGSKSNRKLTLEDLETSLLAAEFVLNSGQLRSRSDEFLGKIPVVLSLTRQDLDCLKLTRFEQIRFLHSHDLISDLYLHQHPDSEQLEAEQTKLEDWLDMAAYEIEPPRIHQI